jgi:transposase
VIRVAQSKVGYAQSWLARLTGRRHPNVAAVALANKNARIVWALLNHERNYQSAYQPSAA